MTFSYHSDEEIRRRQEQAFQEAEERRVEAEARFKISIEMIAAGYKALAVKYHPDKGGSQEDMARLTAVRSALTNLLTPVSSKRRR